MLKKSQIEILNLFKKDIFLSKTIREISLILKKDYPTIHYAVKELEEENIINIRKAGNSKICELKLSPEAISTLAFLDEQEAISKKIPNFEKIIELKELSDHLVLVTGSYTKGTQNKKSDIDLVVIVPDNANIVEIQGIIENLTMLFIPEIHLYVFRKKDFVNMLLDRKDNYGKEIFRNHLILKNAHKYYDLLKEAVEHGFKD